MKAVRVVPGPEGGTVEVQDIPVPVAAAGQVLVRVRAAGLNRGEINQAKELRTGNTITAGVEFAGEVADVGAGVSGWRKGDRVMGHGRGCQAEYVVAEPLALMPVPDGLSWIDAAAFPNVFITAHDALVTNGRLVAGESVLVNGASGGVAMAAIQIASLMGARPVIASSRSAAKLDKVSQFGVDVGIDASRDDQVAAVMAATGDKGVDIIIDTVGGPLFEANMQSLAVKGRLVNIARLGSATAQIDLTQLWLKRLQLIGVTFRTRTEQERLECIQACARDMLPFLRAGRVRLPVDRTFAMNDIAAAHAYMKQEQHVGKIVLLAD
ncbi:zinc-binding dehydrogenase [Cupriavidus oxalaticus]|uniref:Acryloyl-CoA reductase n=1 Tax=Cupriavidus oxalaticus TaxID=96344 RepID=A0A375GLX1_9BURK|nr:zinc-binding dehydrogenase [Cupriavidus oxalaticus]QRQ84964.1 zinc-binding dehydrogenase [Cupriavidus oxalaticus]QRQ90947.1 zinc-binding dehydrogenase [Cupriavidus oxalaticus]WQD85478.1 zinc-binding dehydrogenase [Cupriavidus oxalaticus]SPC21868.1 Acryloyl-CoA reductase [Cupriavidus oxalaticus]